MSENKGCDTPTAVALGLPDVSALQTPEPPFSDDSRPGSSGSQPPATPSASKQGGLSQGFLRLFIKFDLYIYIYTLSASAKALLLIKPLSPGAGTLSADITLSDTSIAEDASRARAEIDRLNERLAILESSTLSKPPEDSFAPGSTSSPRRSIEEEDVILNRTSEDLNLSEASSTHNEGEDSESDQDENTSFHSSFDSVALDLPGEEADATDKETPDSCVPRDVRSPSGSREEVPPLSPVPPSSSAPSPRIEVSLASPELMIPDNLKNLVEFVPAASGPSNLDLDWRVQEDGVVEEEIDNKGVKWWRFLKGQGPTCIRVKQEATIIKTVAGKTLLALNQDARSFPTLVAAFGFLKHPTDEPFWEVLTRKDRTTKVMNFLRVENNSCARAVGDWEASQEGSEVLVSKLPGDLKAIADGKRPARPLSPPAAFAFRGKEGSEAENFLEAVYAKPGQLKESLSWGQYLNQDRLSSPQSFAVMEKLLKDLAQVVRPLQCSLAVADMAENIGGANLKDDISKASLKELVQVMGALGKEAAVALLPLADHRAALASREKVSLRRTAFKDIRPLSVQLSLEATPIFSPGLFPKKELKAIEEKALLTDHNNYFPALKGTFKRPLNSPSSSTGAPARKRTCPANNAIPPKSSTPTHQLAYERKKNFLNKRYFSNKGGNNIAQKPRAANKTPKQHSNKGNAAANLHKQTRQAPQNKPAAPAKTTPKAPAGPK